MHLLCLFTLNIREYLSGEKGNFGASVFSNYKTKDVNTHWYVNDFITQARNITF